MTVRAEQRHNERWYIDDVRSIRAPSVTTIIEHAWSVHEGLFNWHMKNAMEYVQGKMLDDYGVKVDAGELMEEVMFNKQNISDHYTNIGTQMHNHIEGKPVNMVNDQKSLDNSILAYENWKELWKPNEVEVDIPLLGEFENGWVGGTADFIFKLDGGRHIAMDAKSSAFVKPAYNAQISAYVYMLNQNGYNINELYIIQLMKNNRQGIFWTYEADYEIGLKCFNALHYLYNHMIDGVFS